MNMGTQVGYGFGRVGLCQTGLSIINTLNPPCPHSQVPLEDDQIFLHIGELQYVAARQQGKSAAQAYYLPSKVSSVASFLLLLLLSITGVHCINANSAP
jgi:hypothetical protein